MSNNVRTVRRVGSSSRLVRSSFFDRTRSVLLFVLPPGALGSHSTHLGLVFFDL